MSPCDADVRILTTFASHRRRVILLSLFGSGLGASKEILINKSICGEGDHGSKYVPAQSTFGAYTIFTS